VNAQLGHQVLQMGPDGVDRQVQLCSYDVTLPSAFRQASQDLSLT
jgi:hypothetical protein